jgi:hypothetical protein
METGNKARDNWEKASEMMADTTRNHHKGVMRRIGMTPPQVGNTTAAPPRHGNNSEGMATMGWDASTIMGQHQYTQAVSPSLCMGAV